MFPLEISIHDVTLRAGLAARIPLTGFDYPRSLPGGLVADRCSRPDIAASDSALDWNPALSMPATFRDSIPSVWYLLTRFLLTWCWALLHNPVIRRWVWSMRRCASHQPRLPGVPTE